MWVGPGIVKTVANLQHTKKARFKFILPFHSPDTHIVCPCDNVLLNAHL